MRSTVAADVEAALRASFAAQGAMAALGVEIRELAPGRCVLAVAKSQSALQQHGHFHGGVVGTLGDSAGGYAANTLLMPRRECLTAEYKINLFAPADGNTLVACGQVVRAGRSLVVVQVELASEGPHASRACALMQMTLFAIEARTAAAPVSDTEA